MLKFVVFPVTSYYYETLAAREEKIRDGLTAGGIDFSILDIGNMGKNGDQEGPLEKREDPMEMDWPVETLFVTDSCVYFNRLREAGRCAIVLYHEGNRGISFEGASYGVENVEELPLRSYEEAYRRLAGFPWDILETERLMVRESTVSDVRDFYRIYSEPSITYYMEGLYQDPEEEKAYMEAYIKQAYGFYGFGLWTVLLKPKGQVIGRAGLNVREGYELPELGFVIEKRYQGQGYGFEACSAILRYAKQELGFAHVQALVQEKNRESRGLLQKLGFAYERNVKEEGREYRLMVRKL